MDKERYSVKKRRTVHGNKKIIGRWRKIHIEDEFKMKQKKLYKFKKTE